MRSTDIDQGPSKAAIVATAVIAATAVITATEVIGTTRRTEEVPAMIPTGPGMDVDRPTTRHGVTQAAKVTPKAALTVLVIST